MNIKLRNTVTKADEEIVRKLTSETGFFRAEEIPVAVSLVTDTLRDPPNGYKFIFAEIGEKTTGYVAYSEIPGTSGSYELYWLAVQKELQKRGIGKILVKAAEDEICEARGRHIYLTTSDTDLYLSTRMFYEKLGYERVATLPDYFIPGDARVIYRKIIKL